jgi:hypothetical protein
MSNEIKVPYIARAAQQIVQASAESDCALTSAHMELEASLTALETAAIGTVNKAREIGLLLQARSGNQTISQHFHESYLQDKVPLDLNLARATMAVSRKLSEPITTLTAVMPLLAKLLIGADRIQLASRTQMQTASTLNPVMRFCAAAIRLREPFGKAVVAREMDQWSADDLKLVVSESEWLMRERERAMKILSARENTGKAHA